MIELINSIKGYAWGDSTSIKGFLGKNNTDSSPQAEMWIGTHKDGMSIIKESGEPLASITELSFMAKLLAAETPLSIQVHPNLEEAQEGYHKSNNDSSISETYKDANHKPEMIIAFSENFDALVGFKSPNDIRKLIDVISSSLNEMEDKELLSKLIYDDEHELENLVQRVLLDGDFSKKILTLINESLTLSKTQSDEVSNLKFISSNYKNDTGLIMATLMKFYRIKKGEALYIPPKTIHAYMSGFGLEVMASSDNVIRCGLTNKFIDKSEMIKILAYDFDDDYIATPIIGNGLTSWNQSESFKVELTNEAKEKIIKPNSILLVASQDCTIDGNKVKRGSAYFIGEETRLSLSKDIYIIN
jgi:mannose-6-phosphate isomerase